MSKYAAIYCLIFAVGASVGALIAKKIVEKRANSEIASVIETFRKEKTAKKPEVAVESVEKLPEEELRKVYMPENLDGEEDEDEEDENEAAGRRISAEIESGKKPKLIKIEDFTSGCEYHDKVTLYYYIEDDILATEEEEMIDDRERLVGDCLTKYGFVDNDEKTIYVRNTALSTDYEIVKVWSAFSDVKGM